MQRIEEEINNVTNQLCNTTLLKELLNPDDLKSYLLEGISQILNQATTSERQLYLNSNPDDSGNGRAPVRQLKLGTTPIDIQIPRTRSGNFYPSFLTKYERMIPGDYETILLNILLNAKNFSAVKRTIKALNLPYRPDELDQLILEIQEEANLFFSRQLSCDWLTIFIDAKCIDMINESKKVHQAVVFTVVGVNTECKKEIISVHLFWGNETVDLWKKVLSDLRNRGAIRVLSIVTDDFSGLCPVVKSLFPDSDHQLCHVHLLRNAHRHLSKEDYFQFKVSLDDICLASDFESAKQSFLDLIYSLEEKHKDYAKHLRKRADQYCACVKYPRDLRPHIRSTNPVEGINNRIEIIKRCSGGLFHSKREFLVKLKIMVDSLHHKWRTPTPKIKAHSHTLANMFRIRFESDFI